MFFSSLFCIIWFMELYCNVQCHGRCISNDSCGAPPVELLMGDCVLRPLPLSARFVIELCEPIQVKQLDIANFELFSSTPRDFLVSISDR